jgi:beta-N-acetylhexosaminidase
MRPVILGLKGPALTSAEIALFRVRPPAGVILFARNVENPAQLSALTASVRELLAPDAVVMIDQEGGRVARLRPPHWPARAAAAALATEDAAYQSALAIGEDCARAGIDVVTAPVLDVPADGADPIIGDRAYGTDPDTVIRLARAFASGLREAGIQPVGKHVPGHGRATADSHLSLPELDRPTDTDLAPFAALAGELSWLMTAHILYRDLDPDRPATLSPTIIADVIRGRLAFDGVLISDDLTMKALAGAQPDLAAAAIDAGCDLALSCAGDTPTNEAILARLDPITDRARARLEHARLEHARLRFARLRHARQQAAAR